MHFKLHFAKKKKKQTSLAVLLFELAFGWPQRTYCEHLYIHKSIVLYHRWLCTDVYVIFSHFLEINSIFGFFLDSWALLRNSQKRLHLPFDRKAAVSNHTRMHPERHETNFVFKPFTSRCAQFIVARFLKRLTFYFFSPPVV